MTCIRVRTKSRGAHTMEAMPPDPAPAMMEEMEFWACLITSSHQTSIAILTITKTRYHIHHLSQYLQFIPLLIYVGYTLHI
eukprot:6213796-Ditylum_brightwellii.AAC.1